MEKNIGVVWLRDDFRTVKNDALAHASKNHEQVCAIYIYKKKEFNNRTAQRWWLFQSIKNFRNKLDLLNISLEVMEAESYKEFFEAITKKKISLFIGIKFTNLNFYYLIKKYPIL